MQLRRLFAVTLSAVALCGCATHYTSGGYGNGPGEYYSGEPVTEYTYPNGSPYYSSPYYYGGYGGYYGGISGSLYGYYPYGYYPAYPVRPRPLPPPRPGGNHGPRPPGNDHGNDRAPNNDRLPPWRNPSPGRGTTAPAPERPRVPRNEQRNEPRQNEPRQNGSAPWRRPAPANAPAASPRQPQQSQPVRSRSNAPASQPRVAPPRPQAQPQRNGSAPSSWRRPAPATTPEQ